MEFKASFDWHDPLAFNEQINDQELLVMQAAWSFSKEHLRPQIVPAHSQELFNAKILSTMGAEGFIGATLPKESGGKNYNAVMCGLIAKEIEFVDSGYRSMLSIQSSLVVHAIYTFASEQQKKTYLPKLIRGEWVGCFALTEPNHGSDPQRMEMRAEKTKQGYRLQGKKHWIGLAPVADIIIVWAKDDAGDIRGFIVEHDTSGVVVETISGKAALRTVPAGEIHFNNVEVNASAYLKKASGLSAPFSCLNNARYTIAWGVLGAAENCWLIARNYVLKRQQFAKPLASNQLIQAKLVDMQTQIALALQSCLLVGRLCDMGKASHEMVSFIKRNSVQVALNVARNARDMLGANGILDENHIMRHLVNLEAVSTYEGTHDIHTLILGKAQTGIAAF